MRAGGEKRGNYLDRRRRRTWLLATFDVDLGASAARCHLKLSPVCTGKVDELSLTVDRIEPGGSYAHDNIRPACRPCQSRQGALVTYWARYQWFEWRREADDAGIEWDGAL